MTPEVFFSALKKSGVKFFTGVPDSLLKDFCFLLDKKDHSEHIVAANEGTALSLAIGHYLGSRSTPAVYFQNSGLGNALNPLISLADKNVYQIPILLIIGWRGEPGSVDEPQHQAQGSITLPLLDVCGIPYIRLASGTSDNEIIAFVEQSSTADSGPFAIVVSKDGLSVKNEMTSSNEISSSQIDTVLTRASAVKAITQGINNKDIIVSTTGKLSRELLAIRESGVGAHADFLCVGGMGHASSISAGLAISTPSRRIFCLDGDGALQMHLGSAATIGEVSPKNLFHFVFNNGTHDSVGGQSVTAPSINYQTLFRSFGYRHRFKAINTSELEKLLLFCNQNDGPIFVEIKIMSGESDNLPRPIDSPITAKIKFQRFLNRD